MTAPATFPFPEQPFLVLPSLRGASFPRRGTVAACGIPPAAQGGHGASFTQLPGTGPGGSLQLVLERRMAQVAKGYTVESDALLPLGFLLQESRRYATDAADWLNRPEKDPQRRNYQRCLVHAVALGLAALDRLQHEQAQLATRDAARLQSDTGQ